ncbi:HAD-like domain-containing protein [Lentinula lateritia]|uniref:HAD-like domain-containing protein n=1 Tax=Lentinula aff. lateritia TaxID=2804960 RepID=A0ACC1TVV4_9AGAR|nr:HAD-like domain-containing protein [Lentinula aff. lateritia]KAJ3847184.1 HAD-like domain-containing protein [Lentinula lateritia]
MTVRLVTFDIVHTLITPRMPIHVQYAMAFKPYLGDVDPNSVKGSFKIALKALQMEKPAYEQGSQSWWTDVIRRTALGVGVNPQVLDVSLGNIVPNLMKVFSSKEGYMEFEDVLPTLHALHKRQIYTAVISNSDSRSRSVLTDLELPNYMIPIVLSEEEGIEKPTKEIFLRTLERVNYIRGERIRPEQCVHVGDELDADYYGAVGAGMRALLLRRTGPESKQDEDLNGVEVIRRLDEILHYTEQFAVSRR